MNPTDFAATAFLQFLRSVGPPVEMPLSIPARSRVTVNPESLDGLENAKFSTSVRSDEQLVVDRTMTWGDAAREMYGSHAETSIELRDPERVGGLIWYLAEGATHSGFNLFYLFRIPTARGRQST